MAKQIFKSILIGILVGAALFMAPFFLLKFFLFFLIIGAICRLWWGGRWKGKNRWNYAHHWTNPDHIRNMSDEEYKTYKEKWNGYQCGPRHYYGCGSYYNNDCNDWKNDKTDTNPSTKATDAKVSTSQGDKKNTESSTNKTE